MQKPFNLVNFRRDTTTFIGEPAENLVRPEKEEDIPLFGQPGVHQDYCPSTPGAKSTARIKIFQRSATKMLRRFLNLDEVVKLAQQYTQVQFFSFVFHNIPSTLLAVMHCTVQYCTALAALVLTEA